jgi:hypothetical protein
MRNHLVAREVDLPDSPPDRTNAYTTPVLVGTPVGITEEEIEAIGLHRAVKQTPKAIAELKRYWRKGKPRTVELLIDPAAEQDFKCFLEARGCSIRPKPCRVPLGRQTRVPVRVPKPWSYGVYT